MLAIVPRLAAPGLAAPQPLRGQKPAPRPLAACQFYSVLPGNPNLLLLVVRALCRRRWSCRTTCTPLRCAPPWRGHWQNSHCWLGGAARASGSGPRHTAAAALLLTCWWCLAVEGQVAGRDWQHVIMWQAGLAGP